MSQLPDVVRRYQGAHDRHDTEVALSAFTPDAVVIDENRMYHGSDEIRSWLDTASREYTFTRTFVEAEQTSPRAWVVVNHLEGNFPGGQVDLRYQFALSGELISALAITP